MGQGVGGAEGEGEGGVTLRRRRSRPFIRSVMSPQAVCQSVSLGCMSVFPLFLECHLNVHSTLICPGLFINHLLLLIIILSITHRLHPFTSKKVIFRINISFPIPVLEPSPLLLFSFRSLYDLHSSTSPSPRPLLNGRPFVRWAALERTAEPETDEGVCKGGGNGRGLWRLR